MATRAQAIEQRINVVLAGWDRVRNAFSQVGTNGERAFRRVEAGANRVKPAVDRTHRSVQQLGGGMDRLVGVARRVALALGAAFGIRELGRTADAFVDMRNKLKNATESAEEYNDVMTKLRAMSRETRTSVTDNAQSFVRLNLVMQDLGKGTDETISIISTLNKSFAVAGVSTQEAAGGVRQLMQAMGSGRLSGDEFRSVMENLPPVARAIAEEMDATIAELRELSREGKITSEEMAEAFATMEAEASRKFAEMDKTIGSALIVIRDNIGFLIDDLNQSVGATTKFADGILFIADNLEILSSAIIGFTPALLAAFGPVMVRYVESFWKTIKKHPFVFIASAIASVLVYFYQMRDEVGVLGDIFDRLGLIVERLAATMLSGYGKVRDFILQLSGEEAKGTAATWEEIGQSIVRALDWILENFDAVMNGVMTFGGIIGGAIVVGGIKSFIDAINTARGAMIALNFAMLLNPATWITAAIAAIGAALGILIYWILGTEEGWKTFVTAVQNSTPVRTFEALYAVVERVFSGMVNTFETVSGVVERVFSGVENTFNFLADIVERVISGIINVFTDWETASDNIAAAIQDIWESFANWFAGTWLGKVIGAIKSAIEWFKKLIGVKDEATGSAAGGPVGAPAMARGGMVWGAGTATSDSIWGRLSRGEYVIRAAAVAKYGKRLLDLINGMKLPRDFLKGFNIGGIVDSMAPKVPRYAGGGFVRIAQQQNANSNMTPLNLTIESLGETFEGLLAPEHTASQIVRYSVGKQNVSTGQKPWWYR